MEGKHTPTLITHRIDLFNGGSKNTLSSRNGAIFPEAAASAACSSGGEEGGQMRGIPRCAVWTGMDYLTLASSNTAVPGL